MNLGAPYTDIRVDKLALRHVCEMPGLVAIDLDPPASGPEIELTFGTAKNAEPVEIEFLEAEVERICGYDVLASRRHHDRGVQARGDREAADGADPIEAAVSYARHILARDVPPEFPLVDAILVFGVGEGPNAHTLYAASDTDMTRQRVQGLLYDALRALALMLGGVEGPTLIPPTSGWGWRPQKLFRRLAQRVTGVA